MWKENQIISDESIKEYMKHLKNYGGNENEDINY